MEFHEWRVPYTALLPDLREGEVLGGHFPGGWFDAIQSSKWLSLQKEKTNEKKFNISGLGKRRGVTDFLRSCDSLAIFLQEIKSGGTVLAGTVQKGRLGPDWPGLESHSV